jgi:23S rRNA (uridine2552-2'-O)-methyltransferase
MPRRAGSSHRWRQRQQKDPYVERAGREGWRSRAVFKLAQIDERAKIFRRGMICVDLGSAPGGFSQYAIRKVAPAGRVIAVDLLPMDPIDAVEFFEGDFTLPETLDRLRAALGEQGARGADLVMSDMAPNISGNSTIDQARSIGLAEDALLFAAEVLNRGGDFLVKLFQGEGFEEFVKQVRTRFRVVRLIKPKASRAESREIYLLARQYGM